jgi:hypothetical protein
MATPLQRMNVKARLLIGLLFLLGVAASASDVAAAPGAWGIDDPRIQSGVLRSEFDDPRTGTAERPLLVDCEASADPARCADIDTVFRENNSYTNESEHPSASYWMLTVNNDKSFVERCEDGGPPQASDKAAIKAANATIVDRVAILITCTRLLPGIADLHAAYVEAC